MEASETIKRQIILENNSIAAVLFGKDGANLKMVEKKLGGIALNEGERNFLKIVMERDNLFPDIDPLWFKEVEFAPAGV